MRENLTYGLMRGAEILQPFTLENSLILCKIYALNGVGLAACGFKHVIDRI